MNIGAGRLEYKLNDYWPLVHDAVIYESLRKAGYRALVNGTHNSVHVLQHAVADNYVTWDYNITFYKMNTLINKQI